MDNLCSSVFWMVVAEEHLLGSWKADDKFYVDSGNIVLCCTDFSR